MEKILSFLKKRKYITIDITSSIDKDKNMYELYTKILINKPKVVAYFKRNEHNNIIFKNVGAPIYYNYYFMNRDNYMFVDITNNYRKGLILCLYAFLVHGSKCGICLNTTKRTVHCKKCYFGFCSDCQTKITKKKELTCPECKTKLNITKFNMDEMKEYISSKNYNYKNITSDVTEQNYKKYLTDSNKNDFFVIIRDEHTEFIFTSQYQDIVKKDDNVLMKCRGICITLKWKNKLEHNHKLKIDTIIRVNRGMNCETCSVKLARHRNMHICLKCEYTVCVECFQKTKLTDKKCPRCKVNWFN
jgi:hypothetical protein